MVDNEFFPSIFLQAVKGMRNIYPSKVMLVPIKEMTDVLSVESKAIDVSRDTWVRMKIGTYKGDLAKVNFFLMISLSLFIILSFWCSFSFLIALPISLL